MGYNQHFDNIASMAALHQHRTDGDASRRPDETSRTYTSKRKIII